jgi:hypothetical protein
LGLVKNWQIGISSEQRFREANLGTSTFNAVVPLKYVNLGASLSYFGYGAYNQQRAGLSLSKALSSSFSLGVQVHYAGTTIRDYGSAGAVLLEAGLSFKPLKNLRTGLTVFNPNQAKAGSESTEPLPAYARLGIDYIVSDKVNFLLEADQSLGNDLRFRGGISYRIHEMVGLSAGAASAPVYYTFGTSLYLRYFTADIAASIHEVLGLTPHIGLSFPLASQ